MSKQFAKILTICALAIIIPIAIVGTAILLSNSVKYTVSTEIIGLQEGIGKALIKINDKYQDKVAVSRNSIVKLSIDTTGYNFNGWFEGTEEEPKVDAEDNIVLNYEFKIDHDINFKALVERFVFNVSYDNGATTEPIAYGEKLKEAESSASGTTGYEWYVGWQVNGEGDAYTHATFQKTTETVNLSVVREAGYESIKFAFNVVAAKINNEQQIEDVDFSELVDSNRETLPVTSSIVVAEEDLKNRDSVNFKEKALTDIFTIYDKAGNTYEISNITFRLDGVIVTIAKDVEAVNTITLKDVIEKYNAIEQVADVQSGGTITFTLSYFMITK